MQQQTEVAQREAKRMQGQTGLKGTGKKRWKVAAELKSARPQDLTVLTRCKLKKWL